MRVHFIGDDDELRSMITTELEADGVELVGSASEADLVVLDGAAPQVSELLARLAVEAPRMPVVLLADDSQLDPPPTGIHELVRKPLVPRELCGRIKLMQRRRAAAGNKFEQLLVTAVESAGDIIEITSPYPRFEYVNPAFTKILGWQSAEILGDTPAAVMRSDMHEPGYFKSIDATLSSGRPWQGLLISKAKDGRLVYLESTIAPVMDLDGTITHHVAVKRDITARLEADNQLRRQSEALEQARDAAVEASRSKSQFLANMSHELRTPLNAIIGYSEMLAEDAREADAPDEALVTDLDRIRKSGQHLLELINDVLDLSKIEAGAMELSLETFDLQGAISSVVATIEPLMRDKDNQLVVEIDDGIGEMRADLTKLRQALMNLLSNASKFTDHGRVTLRVTEVEHDARPFIRFDVIDTGIGIDVETQDRLFRPFVQADATTTRKYGGTGLGLAISQRFCEMMGGKITLESHVGHGSTFTIELPRTVEEAEARSPAEEAGADATVGDADAADHVLRVLVVDDDPAIREMLQRSLSRHGIAVETAEDGRSGLSRVRALRPDAVVLDVMMPELDGWGVLTELKADPATADIPVVMLTSLAKSDAGFALGAVDFLVKPVPAARLASVLHKHCTRKSARVLVVDDDAPSRSHVRRKLEAAGHSVVEAADGQQGIEAMLAREPDLVLLDLMMPVLDGFGVLHRMHNTPELEDIPVVVVTAKDLSAAERTMLTGARAVLERSAYSRDEIIEVVAGRLTSMLGVG